MKDLWKELVNSIGFVASVFVIFLLIPMAFTFVMAALGDAETVGGLIFAFIVVGIPLYLFMKKPTIEQKEQELWKEEKKAEPRPRTTFTGKLLETSVEEAERLDVRKREHFEKLPSNLYWKYKTGIHYKHQDYSVALPSDIASRMRRERTFRFMFDYDSLDPDDVMKSLKKKEGNSPYRILECAINQYISKRGGKSRDFLENNKKEMLEEMRWSANYVALAGIYGFHRFFKVRLSSDMKEYTLEYPFEVPPLKYCFDCTEEEEEKFLKEAWQRVEDCKIILDEEFKKKCYTGEKALMLKYGITKESSKPFNWGAGWEAEMEATQKRWEEEAKRREEAKKYERET